MAIIVKGRYVGNMVRAAIVVCVAALVCAGASAGALTGGGPTTQEVTITGAGGVQLACDLTLPGGTAPDGGWPGLILFPGLGETPTDGTDFATAGFASVSCNERGTGTSGGSFDLAGAKDAQDAQAIFDWLAARSDVSDTQIGAAGAGLGGAEVWDAAVAGVPFKAIAPADTWSSLDRALEPAGALNARLSQLLSTAGPATWNTKSGIAARSYRNRLHALAVPTLIVHDREDYLFDLGQATGAYRLLAGPKRLLVAWDAGTPEPEEVAWFLRYLADGDRVGNGVQIQHASPDEAITKFHGFPPTRSIGVNLPGATLERSVWLPGGPLETFGAGSVTIRYDDASWKQVVATVSTADGTVVTEGAAPVKNREGMLKIPLLNEATLVPFGRKLTVTLSSHDAEFGGTAGGKISVGPVALRLSVLARAVSR
jgi:dienelactone hydrolase